MRRIGITTTVPIEIIYAANAIPVDLNNIFITNPAQQELVFLAEREGFPRTTCSWIKGLYSVAKKEHIKEVIAVMQGDCSNTHALSELWEEQGIKIIPFSYPYSRDVSELKKNIDFLKKYFNVTDKDINREKEYLDKIRRKLELIDIFTFKENIVSGFENHYFLVSASDFQCSPEKFETEIDNFLNYVKRRKPFKEKIRLGVIGVPPIILDFYEEIEKLDARVVFNEVQRQFAMLSFSDNIVEQYLKYTYPYSVFNRIEDIKREIEKREIDGIIHYVQSFCFRTIQDQLFRKNLDIPVLTIEGDKPEKMDQRNKIRIESFIDMLIMKRKRK
jgi:benzoyl-CoA reductase/2-hydroxyglutaryl-CoA dehydratase subunit BcrC/BadD/HgdB